MARLKYIRPSDDVASAAMWTASAEDATYPVANLFNGKPGYPAKLSTTTGWFAADFGAAQRVQAIVLVNPNLSAGLEVRYQASAVSNFAVLEMDELITIPAAWEDGRRINPWLLLTDKSGYDAGGFQYHRVKVVGVNGSAVALGGIVLAATLRELEINFSDGAQEPEEHPITELETDDRGEMIYDEDVSLRRLNASIETTDAGAASLRSLWRDARGRATPFIAIPFPAQNDAWYVRFAEPLQERTYAFIDDNAIPFALREVSPGAPLL